MRADILCKVMLCPMNPASRYRNVCARWIIYGTRAVSYGVHFFALNQSKAGAGLSPATTPGPGATGPSHLPLTVWTLAYGTECVREQHATNDEEALTPFCPWRLRMRSSSDEKTYLMRVRMTSVGNWNEKFRPFLWIPYVTSASTGRN
ncbi:hypothetical protein EVAR_46648_1 [Eumeta japonica]|uniref:Uncharacterized protein n=1 Tax=Eumeta variegata TaxID=151549 RepID=A0A4C1WF24_EUMVA|nr:hypothetical protein EVAR_46648_1 [Eumeta japonica]